MNRPWLYEGVTIETSGRASVCSIGSDVRPAGSRRGAGLEVPPRAAAMIPLVMQIPHGLVQSPPAPQGSEPAPRLQAVVPEADEIGAAHPAQPRLRDGEDLAQHARALGHRLGAGMQTARGQRSRQVLDAAARLRDPQPVVVVHRVAEGLVERADATPEARAPEGGGLADDVFL